MKFFRKTASATVAFNMRHRRGPYGGGNQWLGQVSAFLSRCGYRVVHDLRSGCDCVLGTHAGVSGELTFSYDDVMRAKVRNPKLVCIQRINDNDQRKGTSRMDPLLAEANRAADHTVFVSAWLRDYHAERWFDVSRPHSVIPNGADPAVFHPIGSSPWQPGKPMRIATHHWSDNMSKGFDVYAELDDLICSGAIRDVELWIVGRSPKQITWRSARTFPPCSGHELAGLLRRCHVCITASRFEPGAMHPIEAMQCGMPLLYHPDSGGTLELGRRFGICMQSGLIASIEEMKERYAQLRARVLAECPSGDTMVVAYRRLVQSLICGRS